MSKYILAIHNYIIHIQGLGFEIRMHKKINHLNMNPNP